MTATSNINRNSSEHSPLYRLGTNSGVDDREGEFEFLVVTGSPNPGSPNDSIRFRFDAQMLRHSVTGRYGSRCTRFQILNDPSSREFERALSEAGERARRNGRRLYVVYRGHGDHDGYQTGIRPADRSREGSRRFIFGFANDLTEDRFKSLLDRYLRNVRTTIIIGACHSGAAVTADDPFFRRSASAA